MKQANDRVFHAYHTAGLLLLGILTAGATAAVDPSSVCCGGLFELGSGMTVVDTGSADIAADGAQAGPDWEDLFDAARLPRDDQPPPNGNGVPEYAEIYGGQWAVIMTDDISLGTMIDTTAFSPATNRVYRGTVPIDDDLGSAYVYSTLDPDRDLLVYAAVERLGNGDGEIAIELNQAHIRLGHGPPWTITGNDIVGDISVRLTFEGGAISSATVQEWQETSAGIFEFVPVETLAAAGCNEAESFCVVTNAATIGSGPWRSFDPAGSNVVGPHRFVELGINLGALLGTQPDFTSIQVRTPADITFGYFAEGN